jgi:hypothetical protein
MKSKKSLLLLITCIISSITNVLYIIKIVPDWVFRIGFIVVIICSIVMNLQRSREVVVADKKKKLLHIIISIIILIFWAVSYMTAVIIR